MLGKTIWVCKTNVYEYNQNQTNWVPMKKKNYIGT